MFNNATDFKTVKRETTLSILDEPLALDHFRIRVYLLDNNGVETLVFTSDQFTLGTSSEDFLLSSANDVALNIIGVLNGEFYRVDLIEFDAGETSESKVNEWFLYTFLDDVLTTGAAQQEGALDTTLFNKLLAMLGHNVLNGEYLFPTGYVQSRVRRQYVADMTEEEAAALLLTSESPDDIDVQFKAKAIVTTLTNGNEVATRQVEESTA